MPTALPAFQGSLLLAFDPTASGKRPAIVYCSHGVSEEHRKRQKGSGELGGSAHAVSQHIIAFFGDTNYINHAQIRYVCEINHSPSGATRPRVLRFFSVYVPIGHDLSNTYILVAGKDDLFREVTSVQGCPYTVEGTASVVYTVRSGLEGCPYRAVSLYQFYSM